MVDKQRYFLLLQQVFCGCAKQKFSYTCVVESSHNDHRYPSSFALHDYGCPILASGIP